MAWVGEGKHLFNPFYPINTEFYNFFNWCKLDLNGLNRCSRTISCRTCLTRLTCLTRPTSKICGFVDFCYDYREKITKMCGFF